MSEFDVVVLGAGAAGLMCAGVASRRGFRVAVVDHWPKLAEKIRISGGGRCNFTNREVTDANMVGENPRFSRFALKQYQPEHFIDLLKQNHIAYHEKHKGQLFCDDSSQHIIDLLMSQCCPEKVKWFRPCQVDHIRYGNGIYFTQLTHGKLLRSRYLVVATGGLSIPAIGATDLGYCIAKQFAIPVVAPQPALVPLTFAVKDWLPFVDLAGLSLPVEVRTSQRKSVVFEEDLLFTHRGLSGPAILQISSFWKHSERLMLNLLPNINFSDALLQSKLGHRQLLGNALTQWMPKRLIEGWVQAHQVSALFEKRFADVSDKALRELAQSLQAWHVTPTGSEGYRKAEVTRGGVSTSALSPQTMQSLQHPGLCFIGEVVDITGWLGGYNFQWAWSSAYVCAHAFT